MTLLSLIFGLVLPTQRQSIRINSILPSSAGSYEISLKLERTYIGATSNLKRRCDQHLNNLINGVHSNNVLQNDFNITDLEDFTFTVLRDTENLSEAERV